MTRDIGLRFPNLPSFASHPNKRDSNSGGNSSSNLPTIGSSGNFLSSTTNQSQITELALSSTTPTINEEKNGSGVRWSVSNVKPTQNTLTCKPMPRSPPPPLSPKSDNYKHENENTSATFPLLGTSPSLPVPITESQLPKTLTEKPAKFIQSNTRSGSAKSKFLASKPSSGRAGRSFSTTNESY